MFIFAKYITLILFVSKTGLVCFNNNVDIWLESKSVQSFIMDTPDCLGCLTYLRIWHDNSGEGDDASWYLHKVVVDDIQSKERFALDYFFSYEVN